MVSCVFLVVSCVRLIYILCSTVIFAIDSLVVPNAARSTRDFSCYRALYCVPASSGAIRSIHFSSLRLERAAVNHRPPSRAACDTECFVKVLCAWTSLPLELVTVGLHACSPALELVSMSESQRYEVVSCWRMRGSLQPVS